MRQASFPEVEAAAGDHKTEPGETQDAGCVSGGRDPEEQEGAVMAECRGLVRLSECDGAEEECPRRKR